MKLIGLTGGIGSGKSTVADILARRGWTVVDADKIAREIVQPGQPALAELAQEFGTDIVDEEGRLRRGLLAQRAFADKSSTARLNAITHPRISTRTQECFEAAREQGAQFCLYDMPLLVEKGLHTDMDEVIVVHVDEEERIRRLVSSRGFDGDDARRRIAQQIGEHERLAAATYVIDNGGTIDELEREVALVAQAIESKI